MIKKINQKITLFYATFFFFTSFMSNFGTISGMEQDNIDQGQKEESTAQQIVKHESPAKTTAFFTNSANDGGMAIVKESLKKTGPGDLIFADIFVCTDDELIAILKAQEQKGVLVEVLVCNSQIHWSKKIENAGLSLFIYNEKNTQFKTSNLQKTLHKKTIGWTYTDKKTGEKQYRVYTGSRNFSNMSSSKENTNTNKEAMIYIKDKDSFESEYDAHLEISYLSLEALENEQGNTPKKQTFTYSPNKLLLTTPVKTSILQSFNFNICKSVAKRIENTNKNIWINIYSVNHPAIKEACKLVAKKGYLKSLLVDYNSLLKDGTIDYLKKLDEKYKVPVFVYNSDQKKRFTRYPIANHMKALVREQQDNSWLVGTGSCNFTTTNNSDINNWLFFPNDKDMAQSFLEEFKKNKNESQPLSEALLAFENTTLGKRKISSHKQKDVRKKLRFE